MFGTLKKDQLMTLSRLARTSSFASGSAIYKQGSETDDLFIIRTGFVRLLREVKVDGDSRGRINRATKAVSMTSQSLDAIVSPRRILPKLNFKVCAAKHINEMKYIYLLISPILYDNC